MATDAGRTSNKHGQELMSKMVLSTKNVGLSQRDTKQVNGGELVMRTETYDMKTSRTTQFIDITDVVKRCVAESGMKNGHVVVFTKHTTAAIRIQENEPELLRDFVDFLERVAPEAHPYNHNNFGIRTANMTNDECPNAHAHCRHLLMGSSETIPVIDGEITLGVWQRVFFIELDRSRNRSVMIQAIGQK